MLHKTELVRLRDQKVTKLTEGKIKKLESRISNHTSKINQIKQEKIEDAPSAEYEKGTKKKPRSLSEINKDIKKNEDIIEASRKKLEVVEGSKLAQTRIENRNVKLNDRVKESNEALLKLREEKILATPRTGVAAQPEAMYSLVLESQESADGTTHVVLAGKEEGGSTVAEVTNALIEAYGNQVLKYVSVVQSVDQLPVDVRLNRENYDSAIRAVSYSSRESSGITMVADNLPLNRVIPVALHEIGAHGFQSVMGKRFYQKMMKQVAFLVNTDSEIRAIYDRVASEMDTKNEALLLEETMAYIVENEAMTNSPFLEGHRRRNPIWLG